MAAVKSSYLFLGKDWSPTIPVSPASLIEQRFQSVTESTSNIRFRWQSSSPRALTNSRIKLYIPVTLQFNKAVGVKEPHTTDNANTTVGFRDVFQRCLETINLEINGSCSIVKRFDVLDMWETTCTSDNDSKNYPQGPCPEPNAHGRYRNIPFIDNADAAHKEEPRTQVSQSAAKRQALVADQCAAGALALNTNREFMFVCMLDIGPFGARYKYGEMLGDAGQERWVPYLDSVSLLLQFKPLAQIGRKLFQSARLPNNFSFLNNGASAVTCTVAANGVGKCTANVMFALPPSSFALPSAVHYACPRVQNYERDITWVASDAKEAMFSSIKTESSPPFWVLYCSPRDGTPGNEEVSDGMHMFPIRAAGRTLADSKSPTKDGDSSVLEITFSEASGLGVSYSLSQLYDIYCKNAYRLGVRKYDYKTWKTSRCLVILSPQDLGGSDMVSAPFQYKPTTFSLKCHFMNNFEDRALAPVVGMSGRAQLCYVTCDTLSISPGACSLSQTLVQKSQQNAQSAPQETAIEKMAIKYE